MKLSDGGNQSKKSGGTFHLKYRTLPRILKKFLSNTRLTILTKSSYTVYFKIQSGWTFASSDYHKPEQCKPNVVKDFITYTDKDNFSHI
jgi:hypothetical protein